MGQRGRAQDAPEAAQGEADQAHRRDGVDVRLAGHNSRLQQVIDEVAAGSGSPKLPSCQRSRARIRTRACPQSQHLAPIDPNSENFLLRVKPLGDLTKKTKKKGIEDIPSELPKRRRYRKCHVVDCVNEETTQDAKLYLFPKDHATRQEWMKMCGIRTTMPKTASICQIHFDFEDVHSFRCRQLMADGGPCVCSHVATLQKGVIPKHFLPAEGQKRLDFLTVRAKRIEKRDKKKIVKEILDKVAVADPVPLRTEDAPVENIETFDSRQYLPKEFVDRSWLIIPEDNSNLQVFSDSDDFEYDNLDTTIKEEPVKREVVVEADPDIFFLGDQCRICAEKCKNEVQIFGEDDHSELINECLPIKVSKDDTLPLVVCFSCLEEVKIVKALYTKCGAADVILKGHLAKQSEYEFVEDHNNVEDEMDTTDLVPENDPEEELLLSGVTFVEPSAAKTDIIPANAPEVESENLLLLEPATPTSTLPLESDESNPAPEATTDTPLPDKPDAVARRARVLTKVVPKISKKSAPPKREKPRLIMPKVPPKKPGIPFISSKRMPKLPPQVKKPSEGPLQEDMNAINKQIPLKRKIVEQRPHVLLLSDTKKELSKHFVDQLKGILNTVTPRPIYLVPRDSSKSPFLVIPEQLQSEIDKSSPLGDKEKNSECEPTAAKKTRVVELKTGTTYEV